MTDVVLLGAGASVGAGVPVSVEMTRAIVDIVDTETPWRGSASRALFYAVAAMQAHKSALGASPNSGIDVEDLFAAIQMLSNREDIEVAPFVYAWSPVLATLKDGDPRQAFRESDLERAMGYRGGGGQHRDPDFGELARVIQRIAGAPPAQADSSDAFRQLERVMLGALRTLVDVSASRVDYLAPLLAAKAKGEPNCIATLNYDRSVELLADRASYSLDTGIGTWDGGYDWNWAPDAQVRLLKLHGSIDWHFKSTHTSSRMQEQRVVRLEDFPEDERARRQYLEPALVFGARGKVRAAGPFLAMLREFGECLNHATRLVVVGYSFRDDHINVAIRRWINSSLDKKIVIVDPAGVVERAKAGETFAGEMIRSLNPRGQEDRWRVRLIREQAEAGLEVVFGRGPRLRAASTKT